MEDYVLLSGVWGFSPLTQNEAGQLFFLFIISIRVLLKQVLLFVLIGMYFFSNIHSDE